VEIVIAREVGYCYGVRDAVDMAVTEASNARGAKVYTFGPVIHNQHTIDMLRKEHNIHTVQSVGEIDERGATVVIRTHGTTPDQVRELKDRGLEVKDATCPFVLKTQRTAREMAAEGYHVVILGQRDHPEVVGIAGQVPDCCTIISKVEDLAGLERRARMAVLFQSTVALEDYRWAIEEIAARCHEMRVFQTVCGVTITRQKRTEEVARGVDLMIIIGGRHSSNTRKLVQISGMHCRTQHIEEPEEVDAIDLDGIRRVGISTGTSTPDFLVGRVVERLKARA
jgi:4-hydroxy-3-methylbut-2-enyl diphosphate reductase